MEDKKGMGVFGAVLIVVVVVGLLVYILGRKNNMPTNYGQNPTMNETSSTTQNPQTQSNSSSVSSMSSLETDINSFDTNTDDVNPNDINL